MKLWHAPSGKIARGHVLDVAMKPFLRALKDLDKQLYVEWNPHKLGGWGCWEIRRLPNHKTAVYRGTHAGVAYYTLDHVEYRSVHHVLDCAFLNYDVIRKLKTMDTYDKNHWIHRIDQLEEETRAARSKSAKEAMRYALRQNKSAVRDLYEMVRSGTNLHQIIGSKTWTPKSG